MEQPPIVDLDRTSSDADITRSSEEQHKRNILDRCRRWGIVAVNGPFRFDLEKVNLLLIDLENGKIPEIDK